MEHLPEDQKAGRLAEYDRHQGDVREEHENDDWHDAGKSFSRKYTDEGHKPGSIGEKLEELELNFKNLSQHDRAVIGAITNNIFGAEAS